MQCLSCSSWSQTQKKLKYNTSNSTLVWIGDLLTVFCLCQDRAVLWTLIQHHLRAKEVWTTFQLDAGFPAEICHPICRPHNLHGGTVALAFVPSSENTGTIRNLLITRIKGLPWKVYKNTDMKLRKNMRNYELYRLPSPGNRSSCLFCQIPK